MIKTDKVVYRTRTLEEYDWLMDKLDEAGCEWLGGGNPTDDDIDWAMDMVGSYIWVDHKIISYSETKYQLNSLNDANFIDCELIEVSDIMENEKKTTDNELIEQEDKQRKIKKIVYTTEVYFE